MEVFIKILLDKQRLDGEFVLFPGCDPVYFTAFILSELNNFPEEKNISRIKQRAAVFLLSQKKQNFIFSRNILKNFFVISALFEYDNSIFNGVTLGHILKQLISLEKEVGGPYYDRDKKHVDLATNVQIAYFLHLNKVDLPNLDGFIEETILNKNYISEFYKDPFPIIYYLSKFYHGENKALMIDYLLANFDVALDNDINFLFLALSLNNFSYRDNRIIKRVDNIKNKSKSGELIRLLLSYQFFNREKKEEKEEEEGEEKITKQIIALAKKRFSNLSEDMSKIALSEIERTMNKSDDKQMFLMPYFFREALGNKGEIFSDDFIAELGLVNVFFWNAFIIYDDFWDEEGVPKKLPTANLFAREFITFLNSVVPVESGFRKVFREIMDKLDVANTWETLYCRAEINDDVLKIPQKLPDYSDYTVAFEPASAHMFGSMIMVYKLGYKFDSREMLDLIAYFKNYLIAMQINDDAYDWEDDIRRGHLSTVVVMLIQEYLKINPEAGEINLREINNLKEIYYHKVIKKMCRLVLKYTRASRASLMSLSFIESYDYLDNIITLAEQVAHNTLKEQSEIGRFLNNF